MLAFRAGERRFAIPAATVREVGRLPRLTPVPQAPPSLMGLANVRGEAVAVIALAPLLELAAGAPQQLILLAGEATALAVDEIYGLRAGDGEEALNFAPLLAAAFPPRPEAGARGRADAKADGASVPRQTLLTFALGDQLFALPVEDVAGVMPVPDAVAAVPHGDDATVGTVAWRDRTVPLFRLCALLGLKASGGVHSRAVMVRIGGTVAGFVVDRVEGLARPPRARIDPVPPALLRDWTSEAVIQAIVRPEAGGRLISLLAADRLLRADITARLVATPDIPVESRGSDVAGEALLLFTSAGQQMALPLSAVVEVAEVPALYTPVPNAAPALRGVAARRGEALPVIDLSVQLGAAATLGSKARMLVVAIAGAQAGLLVEAVGGIAHVAGADMPPAPSLAGRTAILASGERVTLVLSPDALFSRIEADLRG